MTEATRGAQPWPARWADAPYAYLTTMGRRTGRPHRIEIWFAAQDARVYVLSGGRERSDWVRNLQPNGQVTVELGDETHAGCVDQKSGAKQCDTRGKIPGRAVRGRDGPRRLLG
jgi:deazaflavin-dependent oxidoreductase (nitroreductase family)